MNKATVNQEMQQAYEALTEVEIANKKGEIEKNFRGQISSFGAAITMGSLLPAIAFFSKDAGSEVARSKLPKAILAVLKKRGAEGSNADNLFVYAENMIKKGKEAECKEEILNASVAIKLAMNLYCLVEKRG